MENKKNVVKEDELENVAGGAIAGLQSMEPSNPYANGGVVGVPVNNSNIQIPVNPINPVSPVNPVNPVNPVISGVAVKTK